MNPSSTLPVLTALVQSGREWISLPEIATATRFPRDRVGESVSQLVTSGYLDLWNKAPDPVVTLSTWGAHKLGYRLGPGQSGSAFRWIRRREDGSPEPYRRRRPAPDLGDWLGEAAIDPRPGPYELVDQAEADELQAHREMERRALRGLPLSIERAPRPAVLLEGPTLAPWIEWGSRGHREGFCPTCNAGRRENQYRRGSCLCRHEISAEPEPCPGCGGREPRRSHCCLRCGRWGWDAYYRQHAPVRLSS